MDNILVTVVTITYNLIKDGRERHVRQTIESVLNQTYKNVEHIIIDGASNDGTLEIFKDYPHLKVFSEPDNGIYDAMNKGVANASGKYIAFLNSDDFWHDNRAIELSVKALEENQADFSYAPCTYLGDNDEFIGYLYPTMETFFTWMPFCHQTMFTKTNLVKFNTNNKCVSDFDFVLKLILNGAKGVYVPLNFTSFRFTGISSGVNDNYGNKNSCASYNEHKKTLQSHLCKRYNISERESDTNFNFARCKRNLLEKIADDVEPVLSKSIKEKLLQQKNNIIDLDIMPKPRKIQVLFNARDLGNPKSDELINSILSKNDCKIVLYVENDVIIPDKYSYLPVYEERMRDIDAFCSPVSEIPLYINETNIPILNTIEDLKYRMDKNVINRYIKGSYKIKLGKISLFKVNVNHGVLIYNLFKCIPILKIVYNKSLKSLYLFNKIKFYEKKY